MTAPEARKFTFPSGIPGFPDAHRFELVPLAGLEPFAKLRCLDVDELEFVVVPPGKLFPDYVIQVPEEDAARLSLSEPEEALVLAIVTVPAPPGAPSVNLLGPVVANLSSGLAAQVVQHESSYEVRAPLPV